MEGPTAAGYFDLAGYAHNELFADNQHVWEALPKLPAYIEAHLQPALHGRVMKGAWVGPRVYLGAGSVVEPGAMIKGPAIIGSDTVIRQGAYIREYCLIGDGCVVGHASEIKSSIMLDGSQAAHFNYVGDSVLGHNVNLGAGVKLSNVKNDGGIIQVIIGEERWSTGLRKFGAIVGDRTALGCNCVTSPGSLIGPDSLIYANLVVRGCIPPRSIVKLRQVQEIAPRR